FFLIFIGGYFLGPCSLQRDPKYQFSDSTEMRLAKRSTTYSCNSVSGSHTSQSSFSESFFPVFI
ncbi:putative lipoprotein, partial [Chlamydia psittaci C6/98]